MAVSLFPASFERDHDWRWSLVLASLLGFLIAATLAVLSYLYPRAWASWQTPVLYGAGVLTLLVGAVASFVMRLEYDDAVMEFLDLSDGLNRAISGIHGLGFFSGMAVAFGPTLNASLKGSARGFPSRAVIELLFHQGLAVGIGVAALGTALYGIWWLLGGSGD
jgi:hypothetical protein